MGTININCEKDKAELVKKTVFNIIRSHYLDTVYPNSNIEYEDEGKDVYEERMTDLMNRSLFSCEENDEGLVIEFDTTDDAGFFIADEVYHTNMGYNDNGLFSLDDIFKNIVKDLPENRFEADCECESSNYYEQMTFSFDGNDLLKNGIGLEIYQEASDLLYDGVSFEDVSERLNVSIDDLENAFPDLC